MKNRTNRPSSRSTARIGLVVLAGVAALGAYGFKRSFARAGESALSLIPASAKGVVVWDFQPSPTQLMLFRHIWSSSADMPTDTMWSMVGDSSLGKALSHSASRSGLFAMITQKDGVALIKIADEATFKKELGQELGAAPAPLGHTPWIGALSHGYLVAGQSSSVVTEELARMDNPPADSFGNRADFLQARAQIDRNAHFMSFVDMKSMNELSKQMNPKGQQTPIPDGLMSFGLTVGDKGLIVEGTSPIADEMKVDGAPTLPAGLSSALPAKPLGFITMNGLGSILKSVLKNETWHHSLDDFFAQHGNASFEKDIEPALQGTSTLAAYATANGEVAFLGRMDGVPAEASRHAAETLRKADTSEPAKGTWTGDMDHGMFSGESQAQKSGYTIDDKGWTVAFNTDFPATRQLPVATSASMLGNWRSFCLDNATSAFALDPRALGEFFKRLSKGKGDADIQSVEELFDTGTPLVFSGTMSGGVSRMRGVVPINWDKLDAFVQKMKDKAVPPKDSDPMLLK